MNENPFSRIDKDPQRIAFLIAGFIKNTLTEDEHDELDEWVNQSDHNMKLFEDLTDEKNLKANLAWMEGVNTEQALSQITSRNKKTIHISAVRLTAWLAAASVLIIGGLLFLSRSTSNNSLHEHAVISSVPQPGGNRASITLSDGSVIDLARMNKGESRKEGSANLTITGDGRLEYKAGNSSPDSSLSNILATPAGGQFEIELADGTRVWLNAESSISYPVQFGSQNREVQLVGEAYFEVAKNPSKPFKLKLTDSSVITVLGTHFNVRSYTDETEKRIALLEGKVAVKTSGGNEMMEAGSLLKISREGVTKTNQIDGEEILAWKNGSFFFHDAGIEEIMNQIRRWYNVKVEYKANVRQLFNATMPRTESLPKVLHLLELNGYVHFKIENSTIYVLP